MFRFTLNTLKRGRFANYDLGTRTELVRKLRAGGMTYTEIAAQLHFPESTVQHLATH